MDSTILFNYIGVEKDIEQKATCRYKLNKEEGKVDD